ncbi:MAG: M48 family metalloprotease [Gloeotrichia echinulata GP01]
MQKNSESQTLVALKLLIEKQPEFIPAYQLLAEALQKKEQHQEAIEVLEKGVTLFPESAELTKSLIKALHSKDKWLEASITARQFTIVYPQHPESPEFLRIADQDLGRFNDSLNKKIIGTGILGGLLGGLTGQGTATALNLAPLILQGESGMGSQLANSQKQQLRLAEEPAVVEYVNTIGKDVAKLMGRNFQYEFYVVQDDSLNAFALPGGKIFVNTGTILACNSEAELAGVIAHEVSHSVLSHGFEKIVNSILLSNVSQNIPLGDLVSKIAFSQYSQEQERQADILGARALANAGYAADGLHNFMVKLNQKYGSNQNIFASHPATTERISYLEELIVRNGYNRYSYEGVEKHAAIQKRLR